MPNTLTDGYPLPGWLRRCGEGMLAEAEQMVAATEHDVRLLIDGKARTDTFKSTTDPVTLLIEAAAHRHLCQVNLQLDDEARAQGQED